MSEQFHINSATNRVNICRNGECEIEIHFPTRESAANSLKVVSAEKVVEKEKVIEETETSSSEPNFQILVSESFSETPRDTIEAPSTAVIQAQPQLSPLDKIKRRARVVGDAIFSDLREEDELGIDPTNAPREVANFTKDVARNVSFTSKNIFEKIKNKF